MTTRITSSINGRLNATMFVTSSAQLSAFFLYHYQKAKA